MENPECGWSGVITEHFQQEEKLLSLHFTYTLGRKTPQAGLSCYFWEGFGSTNIKLPDPVSDLCLHKRSCTTHGSDGTNLVQCSPTDHIINTDYGNLRQSLKVWTSCETFLNSFEYTQSNI